MSDHNAQFPKPRDESTSQSPWGNPPASPENQGYTSSSPYSTPSSAWSANQPPAPPTYAPSPNGGQYGQNYGQNQGNNVEAILGLVLGFVFWPAGVILSILGIRRANNENGNGKGLAIAGLVISAIAGLISLLWLLLFGAAFSAIIDNADHQRTPITRSESSTEGSTTNEPTTGGNVVMDAASLNVNLDGWTQISNDGMSVTYQNADSTRYLMFAAAEYPGIAANLESFTSGFAPSFGESSGLGQPNVQKISDRIYEATYAGNTGVAYVTSQGEDVGITAALVSANGSVISPAEKEFLLESVTS